MSARVAHGLRSAFPLLLALLPISPATAQTRDWAVTHDEGSRDQPGCLNCHSGYHAFVPGSRAKQSIATDAAGNSYMAGPSWNGNDYDFLTVKHSPAGALLWAVSHDGGSDDVAYAVAADGSGNVYVTGTVWLEDPILGLQPRARTVKYGSGGNFLWQSTVHGGLVWSYGVAVAADAAGNAYVATESYGDSDLTFAELIKYAPDGAVQWKTAPFLGFDYEEKWPLDVDMDAAGNVYMTGWLYKPHEPDIGDAFVAKYSGSGGELWAQRHDTGGLDIPYDTALDAAGRAYVTGNFGTAAFDTAGVFQWSAPFSGTPYAVVAAGGAVYAAGVSGTDFRAARYDAATGVQVWSKTAGGPGNDTASAAAFLGGRLYLTGPSSNGTDLDALTVGLDAATGNEVWRDTFDGGSDDVPYALVTNGSSSFWTAGRSRNSSGNDDFLAIRYSLPAPPGPALKDLQLSPATFAGGCKSSTGKVILTGPAPAGGAVVALASANPVAVLPASVTVPAGATSATFPITAPAVSAVRTGTVTASLGGASSAETLKVRPIGVASVILSPNPVVGGRGVAGSLVLECPAAPGNVVVQLGSSNPPAAWPNVPSLTIPAGAVTGRFTVSTADVTTRSYADIRAVAGGVTRRVRLAVDP